VCVELLSRQTEQRALPGQSVDQPGLPSLLRSTFQAALTTLTRCWRETLPGAVAAMPRRAIAHAAGCGQARTRRCGLAESLYSSGFHHQTDPTNQGRSSEGYDEGFDGC
jgi:hypothetical protein